MTSVGYQRQMEAIQAAALREVLAPFAQFADYFDDGRRPGEALCSIGVSLDDLRKVRDAYVSLAPGGLDPAAGEGNVVYYRSCERCNGYGSSGHGDSIKCHACNGNGIVRLAHPPHPAPVDPVETLAQRQAREVMRPQSGSALAQPPFGQVYGMATKPVDPVAGGEALREAGIDQIAQAIHESDPDVGCTWAEWVAYAEAHPDHLQAVDYVRRQARAVAALISEQEASAITLMRAYYAAEDARNQCDECENEGAWEHCGPCSKRIGEAINDQLLFLAALKGPAA